MFGEMMLLETKAMIDGKQMVPEMIDGKLMRPVRINGETIGLKIGAMTDGGMRSQQIKVMIDGEMICKDLNKVRTDGKKMYLGRINIPQMNTREEINTMILIKVFNLAQKMK